MLRDVEFRCNVDWNEQGGHGAVKLHEGGAFNCNMQDREGRCTVRSGYSSVCVPLSSGAFDLEKMKGIGTKRFVQPGFENKGNSPFTAPHTAKWTRVNTAHKPQK